jgi:hypothetical protein
MAIMLMCVLLLSAWLALGIVVGLAFGMMVRAANPPEQNDEHH